MGQPVDYFSSDALRKDLKGKTVRGGLATAIAQGCLGLMQLASLPILARLLTPADFGLVAMVTVVTGFASMFVDAGLSMATVQRDKVTHQQVSNLFWLATALGTGIALVVAASAPAIAWFYGEPRLIAITLALAGSYVFSGLTIQHQALMRRGMQFHKLTAVQVTSAALGHLAAIVMAWQMRNYWALVARPLVTAAAQAIGVCSMSGWLPGRPRRGSGVRDMAYFGANLTAHTFTTYLARNADYLLIGWRWGATPLGYYERAYRLLMFPLNQINMPIASVGIPALSRLQNDSRKYLRAYESMIGKLIFASGTCVGFLIATSDWAIRIVFGSQWSESVPIFQWLGLVAMRQVYLNTAGWLFISQGRSRELFYQGCIGTVISVASFIVGLPYGPKGVAMAYAIIPFFLGPPILFWNIGRRGPMSAWYLWKFYLYALHVPVVVAAATYGARWLLHPKSDWMGLLMVAPVAILTALLLVFATPFGRLQMRESLEMLGHLKMAKKRPAAEA